MRSPFLLYHKIDRLPPHVRVRGAFTSPRRFEKQLAYLKRNGATFYTATGLMRRYLTDGRFPARGVAITFDDGWKDTYLNAYPILQKYGATATIFLIPSCLGTVSDRVTAEGEGPREHLSEDDVREMAAAGIEMGSHSFSHALLDKIEAAEVEREVVRSKSFIEDLVQAECTVFAYPAGFFNDTCRAAVQAAGYLAGFSTCYGASALSDIYSINRTEILRRDQFLFRFSRKVRAILEGAA